MAATDFSPDSAPSWAELGDAGTDPQDFSMGLDLAAGPSALSAVRAALRDWLRMAGLAEPVAGELLMAAGEACTNAFEHSDAPHRAGAPGAWLWARHEDRLVRVVVVDRGRWKEPTAGPHRGRGRIVMAGLVDELSISTGPDGTTVQLIKYLTG